MLVRVDLDELLLPTCKKMFCLAFGSGAALLLLVLLV